MTLRLFFLALACCAGLPCAPAHAQGAGEGDQEETWIDEDELDSWSDEGEGGDEEVWLDDDAAPEGNQEVREPRTPLSRLREAAVLNAAPLLELGSAVGGRPAPVGRVVAEVHGRLQTDDGLTLRLATRLQIAQEPGRPLDAPLIDALWPELNIAKRVGSVVVVAGPKCRPGRRRGA